MPSVMRLEGEMMQRIKTGLSITVLLVIGGFVLDADGVVFRMPNDVPTVAFSELTNYPERYDQKRIRLRAVYESAFIDSFLYAVIPVEREGGKGVAAQKFLFQVEEKDWGRVAEEVRKKFSPAPCNKAEVEVVGRFNIRKTTYPYGDSVKYSFVVAKFEQVKCLPDES